jgi:hypothetical protein
VKAEFSEVVRAATTTPTTALLPERGCAICVIFSCALGGPKKGGAQLKRLAEALNNPKVALVVGVVAVAVNGFVVLRLLPAQDDAAYRANTVH